MCISINWPDCILLLGGLLVTAGKGSNYTEVHLEPTLTLWQELVIKGESKKSFQVLKSLQGMERRKCFLSLSQVSEVSK